MQNNYMKKLIFALIILLLSKNLLASYVEYDYLTDKNIYPDDLIVNLNTSVEINSSFGVAVGAKVKLKLLIAPGLNFVKFTPFSNTFQYGVKLGSSESSVSTSNGDSITLYNDSSIKTTEHFAYVFIDNLQGTRTFQLHQATKLTIKANEDTAIYNAWKSGEDYNQSNSNNSIQVPEPPELIYPEDNSIHSRLTETITLQWSATSLINKYNLRVKDLIDETLRDNRSNCPEDPLFVCIDLYQFTEITIQVEPGHKYQWWVHAVSENNASDANISVFNIEPAIESNNLETEGNDNYNEDKEEVCDNIDNDCDGETDEECIVDDINNENSNQQHNENDTNNELTNNIINDSNNLNNENNINSNNDNNDDTVNNINDVNADTSNAINNINNINNDNSMDEPDLLKEVEKNKNGCSCNSLK